MAGCVARTLRGRLILYSWIDNGHYLDALCPQPVRECLRVGKALRVPGEWAEAIHEVYVEVKNVEWQIFRTVFSHHLFG